MEVKLYVYDLSRGMARTMSRQLVGIQIDAVYHTAIVLEGTEYFFGAGLQKCRAGSTHHGHPMEIISLGQTQLPKDVILEYLQSLKEIYTPESYDLFAHNCNNFSHDFATFLVGRGIPEHITNLPQRVLDTPFGQLLRPQIDASMRSITQAPVVEDLPSHQMKTVQSDSLPLLKLDSARPVMYSKLPPLDKLAKKLDSAKDEPAFVSLLTFLKQHEKAPQEAHLPDMQIICTTYGQLSAMIPAESEFAAIDLLRYAAADARVSGYLAEEPQLLTVSKITQRISQKEDCPHNLRLVTIQLLCNLFCFHLFQQAALSRDHNLLDPLISLITSSLLDETHTTSRVSAAWLAFNLADSSYRLGKQQAGLVEETQVELAASVVERLQRENNDEASKALLMTLSRLLVSAPAGGELYDLMTALDASSILQQIRANTDLAQEVQKLLR